MVAATWLTLVGVVSGTAAETPTFPPYHPDTSTTIVYLVRHAEKIPHPPGGDAGLSEAGHRRAQDLARVLSDAGVTAVYASRFGRTQQTAEPLAKALGDSIRVYDANRLEDLAHRILVEHRGQAVLVVGHSDTVPQTIEALTGIRLQGDPISYDQLFIACRLADGTSRLLRLRYGERLE